MTQLTTTKRQYLIKKNFGWAGWHTVHSTNNLDTHTKALFEYLQVIGADRLLTSQIDL